MNGQTGGLTPGRRRRPAARASPRPTSCRTEGRTDRADAAVAIGARHRRPRTTVPGPDGDSCVCAVGSPFGTARRRPRRGPSSGPPTSAWGQPPGLAVHPGLDVRGPGGAGLPPIRPRGEPLEPAGKPGGPGAARGPDPSLQGPRRAQERRARAAVPDGCGTPMDAALRRGRGAPGKRQLGHDSVLGLRSGEPRRRAGDDRAAPPTDPVHAGEVGNRVAAVERGALPAGVRTISAGGAGADAERPGRRDARRAGSGAGGSDAAAELRPTTSTTPAGPRSTRREPASPPRTRATAHAVQHPPAPPRPSRPAAPARPGSAPRPPRARPWRTPFPWPGAWS